jgi:transposase
MEPRQERGLVIAALCKIQRNGKGWLVPSQSDGGKHYEVNPDTGTCSCPDCSESGFRCKHQYAVEFVLKREFGTNGTITETRSITFAEKKTYPVNQAAWDAAQVNEKDEFQRLLHALCKDIPQPPRPQGQTGRYPTLFSDSVFAFVFKVYSTISMRRFMSDLRAAHEKGYMIKPIHFASVAHYMENPECTPILQDLIVKSALPLKAIESDFAVDSSGFSTSRFVRWFDHKYGVERTGHDWVKVHLMCGVKTNVVTAVEIHERSAADAPLFGPLVKTTRKHFDVKEISADKAYLSEENLQISIDAGATPYIPFKVNSTPDKGGIWEKMFYYFSLNRDEFFSKYHKRSNVESTFSMIKAKFGDHVRSRCDVAMRNEVLAKVLCHNVCCLISAIYELGLKPVF